MHSLVMLLQTVEDDRIKRRRQQNAFFMIWAVRYRNHFVAKQSDVAMGQSQLKEFIQLACTIVAENLFSSDDADEHCVHSSKKVHINLLPLAKDLARVLAVTQHSVCSLGLLVRLVVTPSKVRIRDTRGEVQVCGMTFAPGHDRGSFATAPTQELMNKFPGRTGGVSPASRMPASLRTVDSLSKAR